MIHFTAYTAADTPNAFQWAGQPRKLPLRGGSRPHLIHGSVGPHESSTNGISIGSAVFAVHERDQQTDRHTDIPCYSVCRNRPHLAIAAMRPNNINAYACRRSV